MDKARVQVELKVVNKARVQEWVPQVEQVLQAYKVVIKVVVEAQVLVTRAVAEAKAATKVALLVAARVACNPLI